MWEGRGQVIGKERKSREEERVPLQGCGAFSAEGLLDIYSIMPGPYKGESTGLHSLGPHNRSMRWALYNSRFIEEERDAEWSCSFPEVMYLVIGRASAQHLGLMDFNT